MSSSLQGPRPKLCARLKATSEAWSTSCQIAEGPWDFQNRFGTFWAGLKCPLTREGLSRASAPHGHRGSRLRLGGALERLLGGGSLSVAVLGGSMTVGHQAHRAWPERLGDLLRQAGVNAQVKNLARGGTTSRWVLANFQMLERDLSHADVILIDYGLNDLAYSSAFQTQDGLGDRVLDSVYRDLLTALITLPNKPAVLDVETARDQRTPPYAWTENCVDAGCSKLDIRAFAHWRVNEEFDIPTLSYKEAVCSSGRAFWMREKEDVDLGIQHPGSITHDLIARMVRGVLLQETMDVCEHGARGADYPRRGFDGLDHHVRCLMRPSTLYSAQHGRAVFKPTSLAKDWVFREDVKGKPGWISGDRTKGGDISFKVETHSGWIQVEFLGTYEDIGHVTVWLDDWEPTHLNSCNLDGYWPDHMSQSRFALLRTGLRPGNHSLKLRSYGTKFKLLGIAAC